MAKIFEEELQRYMDDKENYTISLTEEEYESLKKDIERSLLVNKEVTESAKKEGKDFIVNAALEQREAMEELLDIFKKSVVKEEDIIKDIEEAEKVVEEAKEDISKYKEEIIEGLSSTPVMSAEEICKVVKSECLNEVHKDIDKIKNEIQDINKKIEVVTKVLNNTAQMIKDTRDLLMKIKKYR